MEINSSPESQHKIEEESFKNDLRCYINESVDKAVSSSMKRISKGMENTMMSLFSKALAHSAGDSRKRKNIPSVSSVSTHKSSLVSESHSLMDEVSAPPRPPVKEGLSVPDGKKKSKSKHVDIPKKLVISSIMDTDDDMDVDDYDDCGGDDNFDDNFAPPSSPPPKKAKLDAFNFSPILDSAGVPLFDPSTLRHPNSHEWFPASHVGDYIAARLRLPLDKSARSKLKSECPKPSLPSNITSVPSIDQPLLTFFSKFGKDPRKGVDKAWSTCQDKLLDTVGPLARIFDMAESARLEQLELDPEEVSLWVQRAFCLLGNANAAITHERRKGLLIKLDPKLANLAPLDPGLKADGLLFGDSLVKDVSKFVSTFASLDKAQLSIKKVFTPRVFGRAGRGRSRSSGRTYQNQGARGSFNSNQEYKPHFYPQRGRGYRGRGQRQQRGNFQNQQGKPFQSSSGRSFKIVSSQLAFHHTRSLGSRRHSRLPHRVLRAAFPIYFASSSSFFRSHVQSHFKRNLFSSSETSHLGSPVRPLGISQLSLSRSSEEQEVETSNQFEVFQSIRGVSPFQNGNHPPPSGHTQDRRLDGQVGFAGCLPYSPHSCLSHQISPVSVGRDNLPVLFPSLRSVFGTMVLYKDFETGGCSSPVSGNQTYHLFRRYSSHEFRQAHSSGTSQYHSVSPSRSGFSDKLRKILSRPFSVPTISRVQDRFSQSLPLPSYRKGQPDQVRDFSGFVIRSNFPENARSHCRAPIILHSSHFSRSPSLPRHAAPEDPSPSERFSLLRSRGFRSRIPVRASMVDRPFRCVERTNYFRHGPRSCVRIRCQPSRLGRPVWYNFDWRFMVRRGVTIAHQLFRDACRFLCHSKPLQEQGQLFDTPPNGQCFCGPLHKPSRWHKVQSLSGSRKESVGILSDQQAVSHSGVSSGQSQFDCRLALSVSPRFKRLEALAISFPISFEQMGSFFHRSICLPSQFPIAPILQLAPGSSGVSDRCLSTGLVSPAQLRLSSFYHDQQSTIPGETSVDVSRDSGPLLAISNMVPVSSRDGSGFPSYPPSLHQSTSQPPRPFPQSYFGQHSGPYSVEDFQSIPSDLLISQEASAFIDKAWAPGTSRAYKSAWSLWSSWCLEKQIDPFSASLNFVVNFLASQASSGKSYRTVNLYRSAISLYHCPIAGKPVGVHPLICRLLRGVRFSKPPLAKYTNLWDVNSVLRLFSNWPDNSALTLKMLSAKLTMLLCLVSIKRVSDVKALDITTRQFAPTGVLFKVSRRTKTNLNTIFYPYFPAHPKLCVGQCLKAYEQRTANLRTSSHSQLLISFRRPHLPVSSASLARWVRWVMSLAGIDVSVFGAHSTRGAMASKAFWAGSRLEDILRSADWSNDSVFKTFYCKPVETPVSLVVNML